jgi:RNA polymerase sigma-70 factor (ECF subfamily)
VGLLIFAFRLSGKTEEASDITQETFIKVWKNLRKFDPKKNFKTWLLAIARNTMIDRWRQKKELLLPENFEPEDSTPLPDELFSRVESKQKLDRALSRLPLDYQTVVVLHGVEDFTFDEISQIMGKSLNTVKSQYRRALHQIKQFLRID